VDSGGLVGVDVSGCAVGERGIAEEGAAVVGDGNGAGGGSVG
jgi:hypothetical protein